MISEIAFPEVSIHYLRKDIMQGAPVFGPNSERERCANALDDTLRNIIPKASKGLSEDYGALVGGASQLDLVAIGKYKPATSKIDKTDIYRPSQPDLADGWSA